MSIRNNQRILRMVHGRTEKGMRTVGGALVEGQPSSKLSVVLAMLILTILIGPVMVSSRSANGRGAGQPTAQAFAVAQGQGNRPAGGAQVTPGQPATSNANSNSTNSNQITNSSPNSNADANRNVNAQSNKNANVANNEAIAVGNVNTNGNANRATQDSLLFKGLAATAGVSKGVIAGGMVKLKLSTVIPVERNLRITVTPVADNNKPDTQKSEDEKPKDVELVIQDVLDNDVVARVPADLDRGLYWVTVSSQDPANASVTLQRPHLLYVEHLERIFLFSVVPLLLVAAIIFWIAFRYKPSPEEGRYNIVQLLFLDPKTQTYSLARTQFVLWMSAITSAYVFMFFARGLVQDIWEFPSLAGFGMTFLISLGTLVAAQATSAAKGSKGSGAVHPSVADLFLHGGVLALDRVQQVLWTVIAIGMFLWIIVKNYAISSAIPTVPNELLILMGISSGGYIGGMLARKPGPIVTKVRATAGSVTLSIQGEHLSREASIWIDGRPLPDNPIVLAADPDSNEFAKELGVKLSDDTLEQWLSQEHIVLVVNADAQRSEWKSAPVITKVETAPPDQGKVNLVITGEYIPSDATWEITGAQFAGDARPKRDAKDPNSWTATITPVRPQTQPFDEIVVRNATGQSSTYAWKPPA